jgi:hypothetical protein
MLTLLGGDAEIQVNVGSVDILKVLISSLLQTMRKETTS